MTVPLAIYTYIETSHKLQNKLKQKREKKIIVFFHRHQNEI